MYKLETQRALEKALSKVMAQDKTLLAQLCESDSDQITEKIALLAESLTEEIWAAGYQLGPRQTGNGMSEHPAHAGYSARQSRLSLHLD
jgi:hypothetical protein